VFIYDLRLSPCLLLSLWLPLCLSYPSVFIYDLPPRFNACFLPGSLVRRAPTVRPRGAVCSRRI
jgi:hypothetical protein